MTSQHLCKNMNPKLESPVDNTHRVGPKQKEGALEFRIKKNKQKKKNNISTEKQHKCLDVLQELKLSM